MKVIAADVGNLTDARYFAAREVAFLCFDIQQIDDTFAVQRATAIAEWLEGPVFAVPVNQATRLASLHPGAVIYRNSDLYIAGLPGDLIKIYQTDWAAFDSEYAAELEAEIYWIQVSSLMEQDTLIELCKNYPVYIEFYMPLTEAKKAIELLQPEGIVLRGGAEEKPGFKSFDELDEWFDELVEE
jgi:phosphoribosylanthranilate isomerase